MKNIIVVTGGAGFIGSNLIKYLLKITNHNIISLDNYFTGSKKNHIRNSRVKYIKGNQNINNILDKYKKDKSHFPFWRIFKNISKFYYV